MRILLVEDDRLLGNGIEQGLKAGGYAVDWVRDGESALAVLHTGETAPYAALLLDLGLPGCDGLQVLQTLRSRGHTLPVLVLTARDTVAQRITGLDAGADDYLVKPFDLDELAARLRALIRRSEGHVTPRLCHGELELDSASRRVTRAGQVVELSGREFALLEILLANVGRALSRAQLEERLYGWGEEVESNALEVHIHHLRKKCGNQLIRTLRGIGYVIDPETTGRG